MPRFIAAAPKVIRLTGPHLFVFVGQGVAGAWMDDPIEADALQPVELGHMVFGEGGPRCRCGHHGCVEAYTSLPALAGLLGVGEPELLQLGDDVGEYNPDSVPRAPGVAAPAVPAGPCDRQYAERKALSGVAISGWPSLLAEEDRKALVDGIDACVMGGRKFAQASLAFVPPSSGNDPNAALAFAACCLARRGGMPASSAEAA